MDLQTRNIVVFIELLTLEGIAKQVRDTHIES